jgi:hypothetical protein
MVGGRVPGETHGYSLGLRAPCFSVAGDARTEVRAYLRSKATTERVCFVGGAVRSIRGQVRVVGQTREMDIDSTHARRD